MTPRPTRVFGAYGLKFLLALISLFLPSILLLVSCGGGSSKMNSPAPTTPTTSPAPGSPPPGGGTGGTGGGTGSGTSGGTAGTSGSTTGGSGTSGGSTGGSTGGTTTGGTSGGTSGGGTTGGVANDQTLKTEDVAIGLDNPWSLAFAPDGRLFSIWARVTIRINSLRKT